MFERVTQLTSPSSSSTDNRHLAAAQSGGRRELHLRHQLHGDGDPDARGHLAPQLGPRARQVPPGRQFNRTFLASGSA